MLVDLPSAPALAISCLVLCALGVAPSAAGVLAPVDLTCEYAADPLGLDVARPRFSWVLQSSQRAQLQSAFRVLVASSKEHLAANRGDKWDSGRVASAQSVNVPYEGRALASGERSWWKVQCWDKDGREGPFSAPATFEMGLLAESDWQGKWIAMPGADPVTYVAGKSGRAVQLDGTSESVKIPHYAALKPGAQITISAWVRPGKEVGEAWREIYRKEDGQGRHLLALGKTGDTTGVWLGLGIGGRYVEFGASASLDKLKDGQWHQITGTYDGACMRLYVDDREIGREAHAGSLDTDGSRPAYIGSYDGNKEHFSGGIDDVRVYDRALSPRDMRTASAVGKPPVGWWKLDGDLLNAVDGRHGQAVASRPSHAAPLLRKEFDVAKPIQEARAYISGLGWYELYINGRRVGDHVLDPAMTNYDRRALYVTYDVTDFLQEGRNAIGVVLGNGFFSEPRFSAQPVYHPKLRYGDSPRLLLQMNVRLADGSRMSLATDETWKAATGPIVRNDLYGGEVYDARLERPGWAKAGFDDAGWDEAVVRKGPTKRLVSQLMPPIKVIEALRPVSLTHPAPGVHIYDFGQFFGGWARLRVKGPRGARVTIKYSGRIFADTGRLDTRSYPEPRETDYYILKGDPAGEVYEPRFTFHPVRYVQLTGFPGTPGLSNLEGRVVHGANDLTGDFICSDPLINAIHRNVTWTLRCSLYGMPLDCLSREHWAYDDPASVISLLYTHKHLPRFWAKWFDDLKDAQLADGGIPDVVPVYIGRDHGDPAWAGNYPILVWYFHQVYGDTRILDEHYAGMKAWVDYLSGIADGHVVKKGHYGDHMLPGKTPGQEEFISSETPRALLWTGYYHRGASIVAHAARILGKRVDAECYGKLAQSIKDVINQTWLDENAGRYATGSQTSNVFALALGVVPDAHVRRVVEHITKSIMVEYDGHLHTGNIGTPSLIEALTKHGGGEAMYQVATQTTYPGWGYMVRQGATTIWEAWGRYLGGGKHRRADSMPMWACIDGFFYHELAGINGPSYFGPEYTTPGFAEIRIRPYPLGDLTRASASMKTVRGIVSSSWQRNRDGILLAVSIPTGSRAKVSVPKAGRQHVVVTEGGRDVWKGETFVKGVDGVLAGKDDGEHVTFDVASGSYAFVLREEPSS